MTGGRDVFGWISELDAASLVMVAETGLAPRSATERAAQAVLAVRRAGESGPRPADYLDVQHLLRSEAGDEADAIHLGRSRQDILATVHRLLLRDRLLALSDAVVAVRRALLAQAAAEPHAVVPAYTNGVQAQPTTFGHLMLGYEAAFARSSERLAQAYRRVNRCPLGAAALATTSHPVDRARLAELLGFDGPEDNAFDAAQLAPADVGFDSAAAAMGLALTTTALVQDVFAQFHHAKPWMLLEEGELLSPSTLMPQKRNPVALGRVRLLASEVLGDGVRAAFVGHNVATGVTDYKRYDAADTLDRALGMAGELVTVIDGIRLDRPAALAALGADFATASEAAATLAAEAQIPAADAHSVVSALVDAARSDGRGSAQVDAEDVRHAFAATTGQTLGAQAERVVAAFDPQAMVEAARGHGGPQRAEIERMQRLAATRLAAAEADVETERRSAAEADAARDEALARLANG